MRIQNMTHATLRHVSDSGGGGVRLLPPAMVKGAWSLFMVRPTQGTTT
jgi:hypothetical protein